jgi:NADH-quinone oxidoreductase subunit F
VKRDLILFAKIDEPGLTGIDGYRKHYDGYKAVEKITAAACAPNDLIELVKASGLRGRGGAGFSTGLKWSFVPKDSPKPRYLVVNADESEPGTFKDRELMTKNPHQMIEGMILASYAIKATAAYITSAASSPGSAVLEKAIAEALRRATSGKKPLRTDYELECHRHLGAAPTSAARRRRCSTRSRASAATRAQAAVPGGRGPYACPTVVNNVETICAVPPIALNGADWYKQWGTEKSAGTKLFSVSGPVNKPGNYEVPLGLPTARVARGVRGRHEGRHDAQGDHPGRLVRARDDPGPARSRRSITNRSRAPARCWLGRRGVHRRQTCMVDLALNVTKFYRHESCGKCTPCREARTGWRTS